VQKTEAKCYSDELLPLKIIISFIVMCTIASLLFGVVYEPKPVYGSIYDPWQPKAEIINNFKSLCNNHSAQASYQSIGKSYLGNDIWLFKFGNPSGGVVLWDGQLHGNEDYGSEILWLIAQWLFSGDTRAQSILQNNYVLMIPVVNIDVWGRYNARDVNLNRNFETGWSASAENPGPYACSEMETRAMRNIFQMYEPDFYVNLHQGADMSYFAYYSESNRTLASQVLSRAEQIASELGVSPYKGFPMSSTGFAIGDAYSLVGASSWLAELDPSWTHTEEDWQRLVSNIYPKCLAMFIAMCEISVNAPPHPQRAQTSISISLSSSTSYLGTTIEIGGTLTNEGEGLSNALILLSYSINNGETWSYFNSSTTSSDGTYLVRWMPNATGNYLVKASWSGNSSFIGASAMANLAVRSLEEPDNFSVVSSSQISELTFKPEIKELSFKLWGETGTTGYCNVTIPKDLLRGNPWEVEIDGEAWSFISSENATHSSVYFTYTFSSTLQVIIRGTWVIPEFPPVLMLLMFLIVPLIAEIYATRSFRRGNNPRKL